MFKGAVFAWVACAIAYAWFADEAIVSESIAAAIVGLCAVIVSFRIGREKPDGARLTFGIVRPFVTRTLPGMFRESFELIGPVLWRRLVLREPTAGRWIALRYDPRDATTSDEHGRRSAVIFASNLTPNALPLDIDTRTRRMVLHQLVHRRESAADDPRYPI